VAEINGTDLFVFMNGLPVAHATSHTLSVKVETGLSTTGAGGKFVERIALMWDVSASCEGIIVYGDIELLRTAMFTGEPLTLDFGEKAGGVLDESKIYATGNFLLVSLEEGAPDGNNATYSASFEIANGFQYVNDGELTVRAGHSNCTTHAGSQGFAAAFPCGGVPPYTYLWSPGNATTQYIAGKVAGTYTVIVTDDDSNTATVEVVITEPAA
jgi:hypothetical protein